MRETPFYDDISEQFGCKCLPGDYPSDLIQQSHNAIRTLFGSVRGQLWPKLPCMHFNEHSQSCISAIFNYSNCTVGFQSSNSVFIWWVRVEPRG